MQQHNRWPPLNRKRVSIASQALSPICKVNTLLLLKFNCYTANDQHSTTVRYYSALYTDLYFSGNAVSFYDVVTKQRLRPGAVVFCVIDRPSLVSLIFFFLLCAVFMLCNGLFMRWHVCTTITQPGSCRRLYIPPGLQTQNTVVIDIVFGLFYYYPQH